jgi:ABC-type transporter Mla subunit MlaD
MLYRIITIVSLTLLAACHNEPQYTIVFDKAKDLKIGTPVLIDGVTVGRVTRIELKNANDPQIAVNFEITKKTGIPTGSKFIARENILGDTYIMVTPSASHQFIQPTDTVTGIYVPLENVLDITDSVQREKVRQSINKIGEGIKEILQTMKDSTNSDSLRRH